MTTTTSCAHERTEPVDVRDHSTGGTTTVARICTACLDELPAAWGCPDCQWIEERRMCDPAPRLLLGQPCPAHR